MIRLIKALLVVGVLGIAMLGVCRTAKAPVPQAPKTGPVHCIPGPNC